jgi:Rhodopirellula transposase DDE domain
MRRSDSAVGDRQACGWLVPSVGMIDRDAIRLRWEADGSKRDERGRRLFAASEARAAGRGGLAAVSSVTGLARSTIERGLKDLDAPSLGGGRVRREGGGPRRKDERDATLLDDLKRLVEPATLGDPVRPLLWVSKSLDKLASALADMGHSISPNSVRKLLTKIGFSRQVNRKADEGASHPDRNAQFEYINAEVLASQAAGQPVISVDTKKKELVGNYRNAGSDWRPKGDPQRVKVHDFADKELGKVAPYGVYDLAADAGWVSLGITHDTAAFAVASIRTWLERIGRARYPNARELTITADCGGSNGARVRLWKVELQKLADETGLTIKVRHYPPGTSKWNKIEHRLFCHITQNWRGRPLKDHATIIDLIAATTTKTGLKVEAALDTTVYQKGIKIRDAEMKRLNIRRDAFHPEWNYAVIPRKT